MSRRNYMVDFLKIIATLCVFSLHVGLIAGTAYGFQYSERTWLFQTPAWAAVWIFFVLSGFLNGRNFFEGRYSLTLKGIIRFYKKRIIKVLIPTWAFIFFAIIVKDLGFFFLYPESIIRIITLRYYNNPANTAIGATWYVFVLLQLNILTPLLVFTIGKLLNSKGKIFHIVTIVSIGLVGLAVRLATMYRGIPWGNIYVPWYMNLDLYMAGIIAAHIKYDDSKEKISYAKGIVSLVFMIVLNTYLYYKGNNLPLAIMIYQYVCPTIWLWYICGYLISFYNQKILNHNDGLIIKTVYFFSDISFYFYLLHSMMADSIAPYIIGGSVDTKYILLWMATFATTVVMAWFIFRACRSF